MAKNYIGSTGIKKIFNLIGTKFLKLSGGNISGSLKIGGKVFLFSDNEGGNIQLVSPSGYLWEIDTLEDNLRIFKYKNGTSKEEFALRIMKDTGEIVVNSIYNLGIISGKFGEFGYGIKFYGHLELYGYIDHYIIKIRGIVEENNLSSGNFNVGLSLNKILTLLGLGTPSNYNYLSGRLNAFNAEGNQIHGNIMYGGIFEYKTISNNIILSPGRFWNTSGDSGSWASDQPIYNVGTYYEAEIVISKK